MLALRSNVVGVEGEPMFAEIGDFDGSGGFEFLRKSHVVEDGAAEIGADAFSFFGEVEAANHGAGRGLRCIRRGGPASSSGSSRRSTGRWAGGI